MTVGENTHILSSVLSGMAVGLPDGQMGNSEVGHMNLGAGRVVYQDLGENEPGSRGWKPGQGAGAGKGPGNGQN
ncbi:MAG: hypothetical protein U5L96_10270 [Owenweeksia sp.]|nr:hypothetical protein [Owenweeksia sp.]